MEVSTLASLATENAQAQTTQAVQVAVLKKAMDLQKQCAMQLLDAATQAAPSNPPHLGNRVDTFA